MNCPSAPFSTASWSSGAVDLLYRDGGEWVVVDYKTDRDADAATLLERYTPQGAAYAVAVEAATGEVVREVAFVAAAAGRSRGDRAGRGRLAGARRRRGRGRVRAGRAIRADGYAAAGGEGDDARPRPGGDAPTDADGDDAPALRQRRPAARGHADEVAGAAASRRRSVRPGGSDGRSRAAPCRGSPGSEAAAGRTGSG